jgi:hypothetical protein
LNDLGEIHFNGGNKMSSDELYVFEADLFDDSTCAYVEKIEPVNITNALRCPKCNEVISSLRWVKPFSVKLSKPTYGDFVYGGVHPFLVSQRFKDAYEKSDLKGILQFEKVDYVKVSRLRDTSNLPPNYYYVTIVISEAKVDHNKSLLYGPQGSQALCDVCNPSYPKKAPSDQVLKLELQMDLWKGEDIFRTYETTIPIFITTKFVDFCLQHSFTNFQYVPLSEYRWPKRLREGK